MIHMNLKKFAKEYKKAAAGLDDFSIEEFIHSLPPDKARISSQNVYNAFRESMPDFINKITAPIPMGHYELTDFTNQDLRNRLIRVYPTQVARTNAFLKFLCLMYPTQVITFRTGGVE